MVATWRQSKLGNKVDIFSKYATQLTIPASIGIFRANYTIFRTGLCTELFVINAVCYPSFCKVCHDTFHTNSKCLLFTQNSLAQIDTICFRNMQKMSSRKRHDRTDHPYTSRGNRFRNRSCGDSLSSDRNCCVSQTKKNLLLRLSGKNLAGGFEDEYLRYNDSSSKRATPNNGSTRCTTYHGNPTVGTTSDDGQDAFTWIFPLLEKTKNDK